MIPANTILVAYALRHLFVPNAVPQTVDDVQVHLRGGGELSVSVYEERQAASAPRGAARVHFLTLNLAASCDADIDIDRIDLRHTGLGDSADIEGMYATTQSRRLSRVTTFSSGNHTASLRLRSFTVPKCDVVTVEILGDMSADADVAGEHGVALVGSAGFSTSAERVSIERNDDRVRVITRPQSAGAIDVQFLPARDRLSYGRRATVARLQLTADGETDHVIRKITLTNKGSARNHDLLRLSMEAGNGDALTNVVPHMDRNTVTLSFDPSFHLNSGKTRMLLLKAEVNASISKTVSFTLEEDGDLVAVPWKGRNR